MYKIFAVGSCLILADAMRLTAKSSAPDAVGMSMSQLQTNLLLLSTHKQWESTTEYRKGDQAVYDGGLYRAKWYTKGDDPVENSDTQETGTAIPWLYEGRVNGEEPVSPKKTGGRCEDFGCSNGCLFNNDVCYHDETRKYCGLHSAQAQWCD